MFQFSFLRLLPVLSVFLCGAVSAQSLADVLSSLQERKQAIEQSIQLTGHLPTLAGSSSTVGDQILIEWEGVTGEPSDFPTDLSLATLGIEARVALLNQAILEFRKLRGSYLNLRPQDLEDDRNIGALRPYLREDFPELGRADHSNYHQILFQLATCVTRLRVLQWPVAGKSRTHKYVISKHEIVGEDSTPTVVVDPGSLPYDGWDLPSTLGLGTEFDAHLSNWTFAFFRDGTFFPTVDGAPKNLMESVSVDGSFEVNEFPYPLRKLHVGRTTSEYREAALFSKVPGRADQLGGKVALLAWNHWSPVGADGVSPLSGSDWDHQDAGFKVLKAVTNANTNTELVAEPGLVVNLDWFKTNPEDLSDSAQAAVAKGMASRKASLQGNNIGHLNSWDVEQDLGSKVLRRSLYCVCAPEFIRGLDVRRSGLGWCRPP